MTLVILGICIALIIVGVVLYNALDYDWGKLGVVIGTIGGVVGFIALIFALFFTADAWNLQTINDRIEMYQEENTKIEEQIATIVEQYQEYESDIIAEVAPESAVTLVSLYPELKSDDLVASQIDIYVQNNEKIKELKESAITAKVSAWWLYFGG